MAHNEISEQTNVEFDSCQQLEELTLTYIDRLEADEGEGEKITIAKLKAEHRELAGG